jgi:hypothetical protein
VSLTADCAPNVSSANSDAIGLYISGPPFPHCQLQLYHSSESPASKLIDLKSVMNVEHKMVK